MFFHLGTLLAIAETRKPVKRHLGLDLAGTGIVVSILLALLVGTLWVYQSLTGITSQPAEPALRAKAHICRARVSIRILAVLLILKAINDLMLAGSIGEELRRAADRLPVFAEDYNSKATGMRVALAYNNGTGLFFPQHTDCIKVYKTKDGEKPRYSNERRLLKTMEVRYDERLPFKFCGKENLLVLNVDKLREQTKTLLLVGACTFYAVTFAVTALTCWGAYVCARK